MGLSSMPDNPKPNVDPIHSMHQNLIKHLWGVALFYDATANMNKMSRDN